MSSISMSLVGMLFNLQLLKYAGENGVSAYGVMMYVSMIFTAIFVGYSIGSAPVVSFHFGACNHAELKSLLRKSLVLCGLCGFCMVLSGFLLADRISDLFAGYDPELQALTVHGFRIFSLSFAFIGFGIYSSGFFTALNDGLTAAIISFVRTLILESAAVLLLPRIFGIDGIWYSTVVSELLAFFLGVVFLIAKRKKYHYLNQFCLLWLLTYVTNCCMIIIDICQKGDAYAQTYQMSEDRTAAGLPELLPRRRVCSGKRPDDRGRI